jgi:hypothetical protein
MNMKPILFSGTMVSAILDGKKTQTRRIIKETPNHYHGTHYGGEKDGQPKHIMDWGLSGVYQAEEGDWNCKPGHWYLDVQTDVDDNSHDEIAPKYSVGDILWVRETWMPETEQGIPTGAYIYKATDKPEPDGDTPLKWHPSIFTPKDAARIFLRVTDVRAERLQDISEKDAKAEGVITNGAVKVSSYVYWFQKLWDSINSKRGYGWNVNPYVWVYTFERCEKLEEWPEGSKNEINHI